MSTTTVNRELSPAELMPSMAPGQMADRMVAEAQRLEARTAAAESRIAQAVPEPAEAVEADHDERHRPPTPEEIAGRIIVERLVDLKRSATDWAPRTVTFSGKPMLLCGRRTLRDSVTIFNGSATVTLAGTQVDLEQDTDRVMTLSANQSVTVEIEGPVWANAAAGTTLQLFEAYYDTRKVGEAVADILAHMPISRVAVQTV